MLRILPVDVISPQPNEPVSRGRSLRLGRHPCRSVQRAVCVVKTRALHDFEEEMIGKLRL